RYPVRYERSENAAGGNWTFVGRVDTPFGELASVITFGQDGVFGTLPTPDGTMMQITTRGGQAFLQPAGDMVPPGVVPGPGQVDYVVPPLPEDAKVHRVVAPAGSPAPAATAGAPAPVSMHAPMHAVAATSSQVTIDVLGIYT